MSKTSIHAYVPLTLMLEDAPESGSLEDRWRVWFGDFPLGYLCHHKPNGDGGASYYYTAGAKQLHAERREAIADLVRANLNEYGMMWREHEHG